jgi:hypothetical protein
MTYCQITRMEYFENIVSNTVFFNYSSHFLHAEGVKLLNVKYLLHLLIILMPLSYKI